MNSTSLGGVDGLLKKKHKKSVDSSTDKEEEKEGKKDKKKKNVGFNLEDIAREM